MAATGNVIAVAAAMAGLSAAVSASTKRSFFTNFPLTENPISEGGIWSSNATDRTRVKTTGGYAGGTQTSIAQPPYDDSYAYHNGVWAPDVEIIVEIFKGSPVGIQEIECNARCNDAPGSTTATLYGRGYIYFFALAPDAVAPGIQFSVPGGVHDHDFFKCTFIGNALNAYIDYRDGNGYHLINTSGPVLDTSVSGGARYLTGKPGIGFYNEKQHGAVNSQYGMRSVSIREV